MLHGAREPRWSHQLLNELDEPIGDLDGVTGGGYTLQGLTRLGGYGRLEIDHRGIEIDWMRHRVQSIYDPGVAGVDPWPVATMLLTSPEDVHTELGLSYGVGLLPKTAVIDEDAFPEAYSVAAGANIIDSVVAVMRSTGEESIAVTPSDLTFTNQQSWDAGESKLTIVNDMLTAAGYWSLWADGGGQFRVEPYVEPEERPIAYEFVKGEAAIHSPNWQRSRDMSSVPNMYIVVGQGTDDTPPLVGVARNEDPESQFSFQARGRWIARKDEGAEGANQAVFDQMAQRRLLQVTSAVEHVKSSHELVQVSPNDAIWFESSGYAARLTVQNMTIGFSLEEMVSAEWRRTSV